MAAVKKVKTGIFKKIIKGITIGAGTVLSLFNPAAGASVIAAGKKIKTTVPTAVDKVSAAAKKAIENLSSASSAAKASDKAITASLSTSKLFLWLKENPLYAAGIALAGVALLLFGAKKLKLFK
jgi:hypothetical protein